MVSVTMNQHSTGKTKNVRIADNRPIHKPMSPKVSSLLKFASTGSEWQQITISLNNCFPPNRRPSVLFYESYVQKVPIALKHNLYPYRVPVMWVEVIPLYCLYALFVLSVFLLYAMVYWYLIQTVVWAPRGLGGRWVVPNAICWDVHDHCDCKIKKSIYLYLSMT